jgi:hypothetical protein
MVSRREVALPHAYHVELAHAVLEDVRRQVVRLGYMRGLTVVRVGASGGYRIDLVPAADVRPSFLEEFGVPTIAALDLIDDMFDYATDREAAMLIVESNPIDDLLLSFLVLEWDRPSEAV